MPGPSRPAPLRRTAHDSAIRPVAGLRASDGFASAQSNHGRIDADRQRHLSRFGRKYRGSGSERCMFAGSGTRSRSVGHGHLIHSATSATSAPAARKRPGLPQCARSMMPRAPFMSRSTKRMPSETVLAPPRHLVREAVPRARPAGAGLVRDDEPLSAFPAHPRQPALEAAMRKAEHRPHGPRPDLPPLPGAHVPGLEGRMEGHVEGPAEIAGNPPVQVVRQVADADGKPVDALPEVTLPFPVPCLRALSGRTAELQQEGKHLVGVEAVTVAGGVVHRACGHEGPHAGVEGHD